MYTITYVDGRGDSQTCVCSAFEDAELIAQFISTVYKGCKLTSDGDYERFYRQGVETHHGISVQNIRRVGIN